MDYIKYKAEDFAAIESFQEYYLFAQEDAKQFWEQWIEAHPTKKIEIEAAKKLLDVLHPNVSDQEISMAFSNLKSQINQHSKPINKIVKPRRRWLQIASLSAAAFLLLFTAYHFLSVKPNVVWSSTQTAFGEIKKLDLPDGSQAFLNSNSTLKYDANWSDEAPREVWLEGEASFEVNKNPSKGQARFIVHSNNTQVQVLGTVFNVYNRNQKTSVVLESGKIEVTYKKDGRAEKLAMIPKDFFEIDATGKIDFQQNINTQLHTAWKENKLILDQTPLRKVVSVLEDNFGFEVMVGNKEILDRKLTATIPIIDINILLDALREIYNLNIKRTQQKIWIE